MKKIISLFLSVFVLTGLFTFSGSAADKDNNVSLSSILPKEYLDCISEGMKDRISSILYYDYSTGKPKPNDNMEVADISFNENLESNYPGVKAQSVIILLRDKKTKQIIQQCVCVAWQWESGKPAIKQEDYLSLSWNDSDLFNYVDSYYSEDYQFKDGKIKINRTYDGLAWLEFGKIGFYTNLKYLGGQNGGSVVFVLIPSEPMKELKTMNQVYLEYYHRFETTIIISGLSILVFIAALTIIIVVKRRKKKRSKANVNNNHQT